MVSAGACNPSAIALGIVSACREIREEGGDTPAIINDPAIKLMVHQLSFVCRISEFDADPLAYGRAVDSCTNGFMREENGPGIEPEKAPTAGNPMAPIEDGDEPEVSASPAL